ncbi:hypothetical protein CAP35_02515 [Chitinophagaceae bacterium IBVUCB1]|nr:hypothetical protein CAP35_02515 [Chitinophagaceae bacterium IBVUCB1]
MPAFGWQPIVLTVDEKYYEEALDYNLVKLLPASLKIIKCGAFKVTKPRIIGDIGLRGFWQLYNVARNIVKEQKIDFVYIPIPSFYVSLIGRMLHKATGVAYGIDYIDPWVHTFPQKTLRHRLSETVAKTLEPIAVKYASLITGVAEGYYAGVIERNPHLKKSCFFAAMPYGGEQQDHDAIKRLSISPYLFNKSDKTQLVYAGAMLPKAYEPLEKVFESIAANKQQFQDVEIHFIGTGKSPNDKNGYNIKPLAIKYGLWGSIIFEYPARIPYLDVLIHLDAADGVFILGSTEPHYTPSKVYQAVLSGKPVLALLHSESNALELLQDTKAGIVLPIIPEDLNGIEQQFSDTFQQYIAFMHLFDKNAVNKEAFNKYSAYAVTKILCDALEKIQPKQRIR